MPGTLLRFVLRKSGPGTLHRFALEKSTNPVGGRTFRLCPAKVHRATLSDFAVLKWGRGISIPGCARRRPRRREIKISDNKREGGLNPPKIGMGVDVMSHNITIGEKYGRLTVLKEVPRGNKSERRYECRCECGNVGIFFACSIINHQNRRCRKCVPHNGGRPKPDIVGKQINGWEVLEEQERNENGAQLYKCRCVRCGNTTVKTAGQISRHKTDRCSACPPTYDFKINGTAATGTLPNGEKFLIDAADIPLVSRYFWKTGKCGYVVTHKPCLKLHRLIA